MKIKKLISICAMSLAVVCCTSVTTFAAQSAGNREKAAKKVAINFYKGHEVSDTIKITSKTPISQYLKTSFINNLKTNCIDKIGADKFNPNEGLYNNYLENKDSIRKDDKNLIIIRSCIHDELDGLKDACDNGTIKKYVENRVILPVGTHLTVGKNINGKTTATLEDNNGNIAFQINSENINNVRKELENVKNWNDLKSFLKDNYGIDGDSLK
ncbi:hypothetical protein DWC20_15060 [Clostridium botulinum]|uniref:hypothetical protein n=1 Tax=Clostridium botulinum TaxID=1491 RepID=UPI00036A044C|nr:hypothetical protein [Clostridium botulinum]MBN1036861.1 hypothetical protein [Clostridium botulinum]